MKAKNLFLSMFILSMFTACENGKEPEGGNIVSDGSVLQGRITEDAVLSSGSTYKLNGEYIVSSGATLTIEEGVKIEAIYDDIVDYILIEQGAKINAVGTSDNPIVMTSEKKESGAWGGIHICGYASTNAEGGLGSSEIGNAQYGGNQDDDNSGVLKFIRIEYSGYAFDEEHEANGFTFYGVGNGTCVENCQAYNGSDDGFEFFGGTVNVKNLVALNCSDDSYDWTEGWRGKATNLVAYQQPTEILGYECDCLIEADNNENNYAAQPISHPILKNVILVGNNGTKQGIRIRRGSEVELSDVVVCGKGKPITVESEETELALLNKVSKINNVISSAALISEKNIYTNDKFIENGNRVDETLKYESFENIKDVCDWITGSWVKY